MSRNFLEFVKINNGQCRRYSCQVADGGEIRAKTVDKLGGQISMRVGDACVNHLIPPTFKFCSKYNYRDAGMTKEGEEFNFLLLVRGGGPSWVESGHRFVQKLNTETLKVSSMSIHSGGGGASESDAKALYRCSLLSLFKIVV